MPTDPNMTGLIYPTEGDSIDLWGQIMNSTCWPIIGAHDHTTGNGVKIPSAALKINADVSWAFSGTSYAITDAKALDFAAQTAASVSSYAGALFVNSSDANNLYFRTVGGTNVKITDGTTLNVSIVGGIGGDYSSVSALLDYDDATDTYRFRQETASAVRQFAKIKSADLVLLEYIAAGGATVPTNAVTLKSPSALAASYSLTFPAALPGSSAFTMVDSAGVETFSTGPTVTGTITAAGYKYTTAMDVVQPGGAWVDPNATHTQLLSSAGAKIGYTLAASANAITLPIQGLRDGDQITGWTVYVDKRTDNTNTISARLYMMNDSVTGTESTVGAASSSSANAPTFIALSTTGLSQNVIGGNQYYIILTPGAGITPNPDYVLHGFVSVKRP